MKRRKSRSAKLRRKSRRRSFGTFLYRLICIALVCGAGAVALTVFFKIDTVNITGQSRYSAAQIQQALGAESGDNLFFWGKAAGRQRVLREYPYVSDIKVSRQLPDTLNVVVTESPAYAALTDGAGGCWLLNASGKLLEHLDDTATVELPFITGVSVGERKAGETLGGDEAANRLAALLAALRDEGQLEQLDFINMTQLGDIHIGYLGRFDVRLGQMDELTRKLQFLTKITNEKLSPSDVGVIDLSDVSKMYFWPDTAEHVAAASGVAPAAPAPDGEQLKPDGGSAAPEGGEADKPAA